MTALAPAIEAAPAPPAAETYWRSLRLFHLLRLGIALALLAAGLLGLERLPFASADRTLYLLVGLAYVALAVALLATHERRWLDFAAMLTLAVVVDVVALTVLMHASGGLRSGIGFLLLIVVAGGALVGEGRLSLLFAALATFGVLSDQGLRVAMGADGGSLVNAGITSAAFFATALIARALGRRAIANAELARQRGLELANQLRVSERVIREMQDGVLVLSPEGRLRQFNQQAQALLGAPLARDADLRALLPPASLRFDVDRAEQEQVHDFAAPGSRRPLRARAVAPVEGGDRVVFVEDLGRAEERAQQIKLAALGRLTASIAHEIRNPLSAITHAADLLREEKRGEMQARLARIINDNAHRLDRMVREVLELGRRDRTEPESLELSEFLEVFVDEFCMHEQADRALFRIDAAAGTLLSFDRAHLNQVLWNLLANARRYCSGAPGAIRLVAEPADAPNRCIVHIIDDGPGIDTETRMRIFEPFFTTYAKGTGLGLFIARELCDANGARLELAAPTTAGAHFYLIGRSGGA